VKEEGKEKAMPYDEKQVQMKTKYKKKKKKNTAGNRVRFGDRKQTEKKRDID